MNRKIKYRMWTGTKMQYDQSTVFTCLLQQINFDNNIPDLDNYDHRGLHNSEFLEFTGFKDQNGKEIYEGDIAEHIYLGVRLEEMKVRTVVKWNKWNWSLFHKENFYKPLDSGVRNNCQIIGTVYENPELIN